MKKHTHHRAVDLIIRYSALWMYAKYGTDFLLNNGVTKSAHNKIIETHSKEKTRNYTKSIFGVPN